MRNGVLYWYKNEASTEAQNKIILSEATECFPYKENNKFKILINSNYYKFSASSPKECENWVQAINKVINKEEEKNQEAEEERNKAIFVIEQKGKEQLFIDYDLKIRIENNINLIDKRNEKEKLKQFEIFKRTNSSATETPKMPIMVINTNLNTEGREKNQIQDSLQEGVKGENTEKEGNGQKKTFWDSVLG